MSCHNTARRRGAASRTHHVAGIGTALSLLLAASAAHAADLNEASFGDLSNDRLAPTPWLLDAVTPGPTAGVWNNVLTGTTGRGDGVTDRDHIHVVVPQGHRLVALRVGNQTQSGGSGGSFIGLAAGDVMPVPPDASSAAGLLGWRHYGVADRNTDILPLMALPSAGSSGFAVPLPAGDYTLWVQELASGTFDYRFNLQLMPVPEPGTAAMLLLGVAALAARRRPRSRLNRRAASVRSGHRRCPRRA
jgi:PEP-CTERM motif